MYINVSIFRDYTKKRRVLSKFQYSEYNISTRTKSRPYFSAIDERNRFGVL